jgi:hypothetical protein
LPVEHLYDNTNSIVSETLSNIVNVLEGANFLEL